MAITTITFAAAACSWIDPATGLPEVDSLKVPWDTRQRNFFTGNQGYRFCNFMEVSAAIDGMRVVGSTSFSAASGIYRGPSYMNIPSHAFQTRQACVMEGGVSAAKFTQLTGARTVSPEFIGSAVGDTAGAVGGVVLLGPLGFFAGKPLGGWLGERAARKVKGFPPIWSRIDIRIFGDGRTEANLLQHSIFPSLTFYKQSGSEFSRVDYLTTGEKFYDAVPRLSEWQERGWGPEWATTTPGATNGNPWGMVKSASGDEDTPTPVAH